MSDPEPKPHRASLTRRTFIRGAGLGGLALAGAGGAYALLRSPSGPDYPPDLDGTIPPVRNPSGGPNMILINVDDLGFGDLSCYGSRAIRTPNIDRLAEEGIRFTDFHSCDAVCTPSRAGLLTGRYPARMMLDTPLHPGAEPLGRRAMVRLGYLLGRMGLLDLAGHARGRGLEDQEITLAEGLRAGGYRTGMVGKWHLGDYGVDPRYNPLRHGFNAHLGVPYSNDMRPFPLYRGEEVLDPDLKDQSVLTGLYTDEALDFISSGGAAPFFLYLAHTFPHRPLSTSPRFKGSSRAGLYGDVVQELDWSVGKILDTLDDLGISESTLVAFTSDNGPWYQGSPGAFRGRKGQAFEGGHRVPFLARWPQKIPEGVVCRIPAVNLDLFPTLLALAGVAPPADRVIDGIDLGPILTGASDDGPHDYLFLYHQGELEGVRSGRWKYFRNTSHYTWPMPNNKTLGHLADHTSGPAPLLFDLSLDPEEAYNLAERHPDVVTEMEEAMRSWEREMAENPLGIR